MINALLVGLGSAIGGMARYGVSCGFAAKLGTGFPVGTLVVNVSGSFLIGLIYASGETDGRWPLTLGGRAFFMTGLMGGFTTFSTFSLETLNLMKGGSTAMAIGYASASLLACLLAAWAGLALGQIINR